MANIIYEVKNVFTIDGTEIELSPLKLKYLRQLMSAFDVVKDAEDDDEAISLLVECVRICMKQYNPPLSASRDLIEESFALPTIYEVLRVGAGITINDNSEKEVKQQAQESDTSWADLDLVSLESEIFLLGIWKDYDELERSISMPELTEILKVKRKSDYEEKKFYAAIQGVDLDKDNREEDAWTKLKNKVFNQGRADTDILSYQGDKARQAGFGIGMGLDYEKIG